MTPEEEQRMRAAVMRQLQPQQAAPPPGMINQSAITPAMTAAAGADFTGEQNKVDSQRDMANGLRGAAAPKGRTVGPSNIYVGPNWGESVEYLTKQLAGGYMAGKANKADTALDAKRADKNAAVESLEKAKMLEERKWKNDQRKAQEEAKAKEGGLTRANAAAIAKANIGSREGIAADNIRQKEADAKLPTYVPSEGEGPAMPGVWRDGTVINPITNEKLPDNYVLKEKTPASGGRSSRVTNLKRYVDPEGGVYNLGNNPDGSFKNVDTQENLTPGEKEKLGLRQEDPMSGYQMNKAVNAYTEDDKAMRELERDMNAAEAVWKRNGWDGKESPLGWLEKQSGVVGGLSRLATDVFSEGAPAGENYAAGKTVRLLLKSRTHTRADHLGYSVLFFAIYATGIAWLLIQIASYTII